METTESGLAVARRSVAELFYVNRMHKTEKVVTLPDGTRAKVTVDGSRTVKQVETDDRLDAVVRPRSVTIQIQKGRP